MSLYSANLRLESCNLEDHWAVAYDHVTTYAENENVCLTQGFFLSVLAAVLLVRSHRQIPLLLTTMLRGTIVAHDRARNGGGGSHHAEQASNTIAISPISPGSGRPPAKDLRRRALKKHSNYPLHWRAAEVGNVEDVVYHFEAGADTNARNLLMGVGYPQPPVTEGTMLLIF